MNWLILVAALELGVAPVDQMIMYGPPDDIFSASPIIYTQLEARVMMFDVLFVGGSVQTQTWWDGEGSFWPFRAAYLFEAGLRHKWLEIGFRHYCTHPVMPLQPLWVDPPTQETRWEGGYEQIYIRLETKGW
jgi:hypothetical protein